MGTASSYGGSAPGNPLLPSWLADPIAPAALTPEVPPDTSVAPRNGEDDFYRHAIVRLLLCSCLLCPGPLPILAVLAVISPVSPVPARRTVERSAVLSPLMYVGPAVARVPRNAWVPPVRPVLRRWFSRGRRQPGLRRSAAHARSSRSRWAAAGRDVRLFDRCFLSGRRHHRRGSRARRFFEMIIDLAELGIETIIELAPDRMTELFERFAPMR